MAPRRGVLWLLAGLLSLPGILVLRDGSVDTGLVIGSESAEVERRLSQDFTSPFEETGVLVVSGLATPAFSDSGRALFRELEEAVARFPGVRAVVSPGTVLDTLLTGVDGTTGLVLVGLDRGERDLVDSLRIRTRGLTAQLRSRHPDARLRWTGALFLQDDLRRAGAASARRAELLALPLTLLAAALGFGGWRVLARAALAVLGALVTGWGVTGAVSLVLPVSPLVGAAVSIVAAALTLDYFLVLTRGPFPPEVARRTVWTAAVAVALGYAGLALAPTGELRSAALAGVGVSFLAALAALSAAPARTDAPPPLSLRWLAWGRFVTRHPVRVLIVCLLPLGYLTSVALQARLRTPLDGWLPVAEESTVALTELERAGRGAMVGVLRGLLTLPDTDLLSEPGWEGLRRAGRGLGGVSGVAEVRSLATVGTGELVVAQHVLPDQVRAIHLSGDRQTAILDLFPDFGLPRDSLPALVQRVREVDAHALTGIPGARLAIGGVPARILDYEQGTRNALPRVVIAIVVATLLVLGIVFRAPVLALKAVALNLLVAGAAIGVTTLVFQDGVGAAWLGHDPLGAVLPTVPLVAFGLTFGLSMDYEIFLLSAFRHARTLTRDDAEAITVAVASSGAVITRAATIMAALFLAAALSDLVPLAMLGVTLAAAVALEATLVRLALAPALLRLAGRWNWWPVRDEFCA